MDYNPDDLTGEGYYRVWYGRAEVPAGPFVTVRDLAAATGLRDHPRDGYVLFFAPHDPVARGPLVSSVPSLNPDDLC